VRLRIIQDHISRVRVHVAYDSGSGHQRGAHREPGTPDDQWEPQVWKLASDFCLAPAIISCMNYRLIHLYRALFARRRFYRLNRFLFSMSLRGMGILNYENPDVSGEAWLLRHCLRGLPQPVVVDVGANVGRYARGVMKAAPAAEVYALEPHPLSFERLQQDASEHGYYAHNLACGERKGRATLYDYTGDAQGSSHASLYREVIEELHHKPAAAWEVELTTLDCFLEREEIQHVDLLKIDAEGSELAVLRGAGQALHRDAVDLIQFEFNEMNVASRAFFRDFYTLLDGFAFYRLLPAGAIPLGNYSPLLCEIFAFQNIVAVRMGSRAERKLAHG
jgi:FkbM family methyltransferase